MADRLLDEYMNPGRTVHPIKWPGSDAPVGLLMLTCAELAAAEVDARAAVVERKLSLEALVNRELLEREEEVQQVARMVVAVDSHSQRVFKDADEVREKLQPWERSYFVTWQLGFMEEQRKAMTWPDEEGEE